MLDDIIKETEAHMQKTVRSYRIELDRLRTGRAHTSLVEGVKVDYYGNATALKHIANIAVSDARTLIVTPWEKNMVKPIEKAILSANLGLNPVGDAHMVRVPIPPLTEERRKEMTKLVRNIAEQARIAIRNLRRDAITQLKELLKHKNIDEDGERRGQDLVQKTTDKFIGEIDKLAVAKEDELLQV